MPEPGVCMVSSHFTPRIGGAERQVDLLSGWLARRGVPVTVLTRRFGDLPAFEERAGVSVYRIGVPTGKAASAATFVARGLELMIRQRRRFEVIHSHQMFSPSTVGWMGARLLGRPLVVNPHLGGPAGDVARLLRRPLRGRLRLARLGRDAAAFVAISADIADELRRHAVPAHKIHRLTNAVDTAAFRPIAPADRAAVRRCLELPPVVPLVAFVGRLTRIKGLATLLEAWEQVPPPAQLLVIGEGELEPELRATADRRVPGRVRFLGPRQDVHAYLQAVDAWTLPSSGEGLPMSLLEAMASGLPVVSTPVGAIPELIEPGQNGLLVAPGDAAGLAAALRRVLETSDDVREMGRRARETALARFGLDRVGQSYLELFDRVRQARS